ncbi:MAG: DinB family protein [Spirochaetales bacterium]|nr:DinB family protein [Spirochaetales bacterium]
MKKEALIRQLANGPAVLEDLISAIPPERLDREFGPGVWTVHEHVHHLAMTQVTMQKRIQLFFKKERPEIVPFSPDRQAEKPVLKPIAELLAAYAEWRARQVESVKKADDSIWSKQAIHPEYEHYDFPIAVLHILTHDGFHFYRIEELGLLKAENVKPI